MNMAMFMQLIWLGMAFTALFGWFGVEVNNTNGFILLSIANIWQAAYWIKEMKS